MEIKVKKSIFRVSFQHHVEQANPSGLCATDGTTCSIRDTDKNDVAVGFSYRNPCDIYSKKVGRKVSFGRALLKLIPGKKNKKARTKIWNDYFQVLCNDKH